MFLAALERMYPRFRRSQATCVPGLARAGDARGDHAGLFRARLLPPSANLARASLHRELGPDRQRHAERERDGRAGDAAGRGAAESLLHGGRASAPATAVSRMTRHDLASVSLDLDDLWTYLRTRGDPEWERRGPPTCQPSCRECSTCSTRSAADHVLRRRARTPPRRPMPAAPGDQRTGPRGGEPLVLPRVLASPLSPGSSRPSWRGPRTRSSGPPGSGRRLPRPGFSWTPPARGPRDRGYLYDASTLPTYLGPLARVLPGHGQAHPAGAKQRGRSSARSGTVSAGPPIPVAIAERGRCSRSP